MTITTWTAEMGNNVGEFEHPPSIALDFDDTVTACPLLWRLFLSSCRYVGADVKLVTFRWDKGNNDDIEAFAKQHSIPIIYCNGLQKKQVCHDLGWSPDIWIDDMPMLIPTHDELSFILQGVEKYDRKSAVGSEVAGTVSDSTS